MKFDRMIREGRFLRLSALAALLFGLSYALFVFSRPTLTSTSAKTVAPSALNSAFGKLPLYFVENRGQADDRVAFYIQGKDKTVYFTPEGVTFSLSGKPGAAARHTVKLDFVGANSNVRPIGLEQSEAVFSHFSGGQKQWKGGLKSYSKIVYRNLWLGIDLVYAGTVNRMKYSFVVKPGADPKQIKLAYRGAEAVRINADGELEIATPVESFKDDRPVSHQEVNGRQIEISTSFHLEKQSAIEYGFTLGDYDRSRELVIDPTVLIYCGYIGGSGGGTDNEAAANIAVDGSGNAYIVGHTDSPPNTFPIVAGPDTTPNGGVDAFVAKVNAAGSALIYCGYIGGNKADFGVGIAVDGGGNAYISGYTASDQTSFPVLNGPDLTFNGGDEDVFVAKINAAGTALLYCGYIGGDGQDTMPNPGNTIAVDAAGNAYVTGTTESTETTFPNGGGFDALPGFDQTFNGFFDAFVVRVSATGLVLNYASYLGGVSYDEGAAIAVDGSGNAYLTGNTQSDEGSFPVAGGLDLTYNGGVSDAFVAELNAAGTGRVYCGYIGGGSLDAGSGIKVDAGGNAYVTGRTTSDQTTFPDGDGFGAVPGADKTQNGNADAFVVKVAALGAGLSYATYIGGNDNDSGSGLALDASNNAYVTGATVSTQTSFPNGSGFGVIPGFDQTQNGLSDAFVVKLNAAGTAFTYATYLGGSGNENLTGGGIAVDAGGNAYLTGNTNSDQSSFPVNVGPDLTYNQGVQDGFVMKLNATGTALMYSGYIGGKGTGDDLAGGIAVDNAGNAYVTGQTQSNQLNFPVAAGPDLSFNGDTDAFVAKINAAGTALVYLGYIGGSAADVGTGIAVDSAGNAYVTGGTNSDQTSFPVVGGPDLTFNGSGDAFVAKVNASGSALIYCGYVGGDDAERGNAIAIDAVGNVYIAGQTFSAQATFPDGDGFGGLPGFDQTFNDANFSSDAFIVKINAAGSAFSYASYLGGDKFDAATSLAVEPGGIAYVAGQTSSAQAGFPGGAGFGATPGFDQTYNGGFEDGFLVKLNAAGTTLGYATYLGGDDDDFIAGVAIDGAGNAYVTGGTNSATASFPVLGGPGLTRGAGFDAFVAKFNAAGTALSYCGYIGGNGNDAGRGIAVGVSGNAYIVGETTSTEASFPETDGPDLSFNGGGDLFAAKLNPAGTALNYCGYIGGSGNEFAAAGNGIALDAGGNAYIYGNTNSSPATLPVTGGPSLSYSGGVDTFVAKVGESTGCPGIAISPSALPAGTSGLPYTQQLTASGGSAPYTFTISAGNLPVGLNLFTDGLLAGTPTVFGTFNFTVTATAANSCAGTQNYSLVINPPCGTLSIDPPFIPTGMVGTNYNQPLTGGGGTAPYSFTVISGVLPSGVSLNANGVLIGTPQFSGSFTFTVRVMDANGCQGTRTYFLSVSGGGLQFYPLAHPVRLLETRPGLTGCFAPGAPIAGGTSRTQTARGTCDGLTIPPNAAAITGNITSVQSGGGFLTLYPSDAAQPLVANSNYGPNEVINNVFTVGLGATGPDAGAFKIFALNTTHVVVDVTGYYAPPSESGLYFHPLPKPIRLLETRAGLTGCFAPGTPIAANTDTPQPARVICDGVTIPFEALAIVGNATTVGPQSGGFLTLFPADATRPLAASSNYGTNQIVNGPFTAGLSAEGEFNIYSSAKTDLVVDVLGYYSPEVKDVNGTGLLFTPLTKPVRLLETRAGLTGCFTPGAPIIGDTERTQLARGTCNGETIPASALAVVGNATVVNANGGFLTLWPSNADRPTVATSNFNAGQIVNRHFIVGLGSDGAFKIYTRFTTDLVIDLSGYFAP
ncbi:MAG TPA: SBBP repeat-containing protein [Blastocatellia bacterium]|nr:SBBP repeat-containing protein [Blastocatellia bacterium]HMZ17495.1 SBBP repeat-containing protein [Blastocatellia bacterium]HNG33377.1 SBBP repeat-containing protein [Blastocatellia bacterium]